MNLEKSSKKANKENLDDSKVESSKKRRDRSRSPGKEERKARHKSKDSPVRIKPVSKKPMPTIDEMQVLGSQSLAQNLTLSKAKESVNFDRISDDVPLSVFDEICNNK